MELSALIQNVGAQPTDMCSLVDTARVFFERAEQMARENKVVDAYVSGLLSLIFLRLAQNMGWRESQLDAPETQCGQSALQLCSAVGGRCSARVVIDAVLQKVRLWKEATTDLLARVPEHEGEIERRANEFAVVSAEALAGDCFAKILGQAQAKADMINGFVRPLLFPNLFGKITKGILLYGPPGTGKTLLAKAAVTELSRQANGRIQVLFFSPTGAELKGKFVGETEQKITDLFDGAAERAKLCLPGAREPVPSLSVIFIDEVDSIAPKGRGGSGPNAQVVASAVNTLLQKMDGLTSSANVVVLAATNYPWSLDDAFLRRLPVRIFIDLPTQRDIERKFNRDLSELLESAMSLDEFQKQFFCEQELTKAARAAKPAEPKQCVAPDPFSWRTSPQLTPYLREQFGDGKTFANLAGMLYKEGYSLADADGVWQRAVKRAADRALQRGKFYDHEGLLLPAETAPSDTVIEYRTMAHDEDWIEYLVIFNRQFINVDSAQSQYITPLIDEAVDGGVFIELEPSLREPPFLIALYSKRMEGADAGYIGVDWKLDVNVDYQRVFSDIAKGRFQRVREWLFGSTPTLEDNFFIGMQAFASQTFPNVIALYQKDEAWFVQDIAGELILWSDWKKFEDFLLNTRFTVDMNGISAHTEATKYWKGSALAQPGGWSVPEFAQVRVVRAGVGDLVPGDLAQNLRVRPYNISASDLAHAKLETKAVTNRNSDDYKNLVKYSRGQVVKV